MWLSSLGFVTLRSLSDAHMLGVDLDAVPHSLPTYRFTPHQIGHRPLSVLNQFEKQYD